MSGGCRNVEVSQLYNCDKIKFYIIFSQFDEDFHEYKLNTKCISVIYINKIHQIIHVYISPWQNCLGFGQIMGWNNVNISTGAHTINPSLNQ